MKITEESHNELVTLRARLANAEAERDRLHRECNNALNTAMRTEQRAEAAEARVKELEAAVEAQQQLRWAVEKAGAENAARLRAVTEAAKCVVARWETPLWKEAEPTASLIYRLRDALDAAKSGAIPPHPDSERLDWLCEYITANGLKGMEKITWTLLDDDGESLMHRKTVSEDEVGEVRFDRAAIDAARNGGNQE